MFAKLQTSGDFEWLMNGISARAHQKKTPAIILRNPDKANCCHGRRTTHSYIFLACSSITGLEIWWIWNLSSFGTSCVIRLLSAYMFFILIKLILCQFMCFRRVFVQRYLCLCPCSLKQRTVNLIHVMYVVLSVCFDCNWSRNMLPCIIWFRRLRYINFFPSDSVKIKYIVKHGI